MPRNKYKRRATARSATEIRRDLQRDAEKEVLRQRLLAGRDPSEGNPLDEPTGLWRWRSRLTLERIEKVTSSLAMRLLVRGEIASRDRPGQARRKLDDRTHCISRIIGAVEQHREWANPQGTFTEEDVPSLKIVLRILSDWQAQAHRAMEREEA